MDPRAVLRPGILVLLVVTVFVPFCTPVANGATTFSLELIGSNVTVRPLNSSSTVVQSVQALDSSGMRFSMGQFCALRSRLFYVYTVSGCYGCAFITAVTVPLGVRSTSTAMPTGWFDVLANDTSCTSALILTYSNQALTVYEWSSLTGQLIARMTTAWILAPQIGSAAADWSSGEVWFAVRGPQLARVALNSSTASASQWPAGIPVGLSSGLVVGVDGVRHRTCPACTATALPLADGLQLGHIGPGVLGRAGDGLALAFLQANSSAGVPLVTGSAPLAVAGLVLGQGQTAQPYDRLCPLRLLTPIVANYSFAVEVEARDMFGTALGTSGWSFAATLTASDGTLFSSAAAADQGNGTYVLQVRPTVAGAASLAVLGPQGQHVASSPQPVTVLAPGVEVDYPLTAGRAVASETGLRGQFRIRLTAPVLNGATVTVPLASGNRSVALVDSDNVTFTLANWDAWQTVQVLAVPDATRAGRRFTTVQIGPAVSDAWQWHGMPATRTEAPVTVLDAETDSGGRLQVDRPWPLPRLNEFDGGAFVVNVSLGEPISAPCTVNVTVNSSSEAVVQPAQLAFTPGNWFAAQAVTIVGLADHRRDGDQGVRIRFDAVLNGSAVQEILETINTDYMGRIIATAPSGNVSELLTEAWFTVALETAPNSDVTVPIASSDTSRGTVSVSQVVFGAANWSVPVNITVRGVNNEALDIDVLFAVALGPSVSTDDLFDGSAQVLLHFLLKHIEFPVYNRSSPDVASQAGSEIGVVGHRFFPGMKAYVGAQQTPALAVTVENTTYARVYVPPSNVTGYQRLALVNADGGSTAADAAVYYTAACAMQGFYADATGTCRACPTGAVCPGGNRIRAMAGYYTPGENLLYVVECAPPSGRCPGGASGACAAAYDGFLCEACAPGFFRSGRDCQTCSSSMLAVAAAMIAAAAMVGLGAVFVTADKPWTRVWIAWTALGCVSTLWVLGADQLAGDSAAALRAMVQALSAFAADMSIVHALCLASYTPLAAAFATVVVVLCSAAFWTVIVAAYTAVRSMRRRAGPPPLEPISLLTRFLNASEADREALYAAHRRMEQLLPSQHRRQALEWLFAHLLVLSPALVARFADSLACMRVGDSWRLRLMPDVLCWASTDAGTGGSHWALLILTLVAAVGVAVLLVLMWLRARRAPPYTALHGVQRAVRPSENGIELSSMHVGLAWAVCALLPWLRTTALGSPYLSIGYTAAVAILCFLVCLSVLLRGSRWAALMLLPTLAAAVAALCVAVSQVAYTVPALSTATGAIAMACLLLAFGACVVGAVRQWRMEAAASRPDVWDRHLMRALTAAFEKFVAAYTDDVIRLAEEWRAERKQRIATDLSVVDSQQAAALAEAQERYEAQRRAARELRITGAVTEAHLQEMEQEHQRNVLRVQHRFAAERAQAERVAERRADADLLERRKEVLRMWTQHLVAFTAALHALSDQLDLESVATEHEAAFNALSVTLLAQVAREQARVEAEMRAAESAARAKFESQLSDYDQLQEMRRADSSFSGSAVLPGQPVPVVPPGTTADTERREAFIRRLQNERDTALAFLAAEAEQQQRALLKTQATDLHLFEQRHSRVMEVILTRLRRLAAGDAVGAEADALWTLTAASGAAAPFPAAVLAPSDSALPLPVDNRSSPAASLTSQRRAATGDAPLPFAFDYGGGDAPSSSVHTPAPLPMLRVPAASVTAKPFNRALSALDHTASEASLESGSAAGGLFRASAADEPVPLPPSLPALQSTPAPLSGLRHTLRARPLPIQATPSTSSAAVAAMRHMSTRLHPGFAPAAAGPTTPPLRASQVGLGLADSPPPGTAAAPPAPPRLSLSLSLAPVRPAALLAKMSPLSAGSAAPGDTETDEGFTFGGAGLPEAY